MTTKAASCEEASTRSTSTKSVDVATLYPSSPRVVLHAAKVTCRVAALCSLLCIALEAPFLSLVDWCRDQRVSGNTFFVVAASAVYGLCAAFYALFFWLCDTFGWFRRYKIKRSASLKNPAGLEQRAYLRVAFYHAISLAFMAYMTAHDPYPDASTALPGFWDMCAQFALGVLVHFEVSGFLAHLLMHKWSWLYRNSHKLHHQFVETIPVAAEYVAFWEIILGSAGGYDAFRPYPMLMYLVYIAWRITDTYEVHSGYSFQGTFLSSIGLLNGHRAEFHDYHHSHNNGNYGEMVFMDFIFHTCDGYLLHLHEQGKRAI